MAINIYLPTPTELRLVKDLHRLVIYKINVNIGVEGEQRTADKLGLSGPTKLKNLLSWLLQPYGDGWDLTKAIRILDCLDGGDDATKLIVESLLSDRQTAIYGIIECGQALGVSPQRAHQLREERNNGFPEPDFFAGIRPYWLASKFDKYAADRKNRLGQRA